MRIGPYSSTRPVNFEGVRNYMPNFEALGNLMSQMQEEYSLFEDASLKDYSDPLEADAQLARSLYEEQLSAADDISTIFASDTGEGRRQLRRYIRGLENDITSGTRAKINQNYKAAQTFKANQQKRYQKGDIDEYQLEEALYGISDFSGSRDADGNLVDISLSTPMDGINPNEFLTDLFEKKKESYISKGYDVKKVNGKLMFIKEGFRGITFDELMEEGVPILQREMERTGQLQARSNVTRRRRYGNIGDDQIAEKLKEKYRSQFKEARSKNNKLVSEFTDTKKVSEMKRILEKNDVDTSNMTNKKVKEFYADQRQRLIDQGTTLNNNLADLHGMDPDEILAMDYNANAENEVRDIVRPYASFFEKMERDDDWRITDNPYVEAELKRQLEDYKARKGKEARVAAMRINNKSRGAWLQPEQVMAGFDAMENLRQQNKDIDKEIASGPTSERLQELQNMKQENERLMIAVDANTKEMDNWLVSQGRRTTKSLGVLSHLANVNASKRKAIMKDLNSALDKDLAEGKITQEEADRIKNDLVKAQATQDGGSTLAKGFDSFILDGLDAGSYENTSFGDVLSATADEGRSNAANTEIGWWAGITGSYEAQLKRAVADYGKQDIDTKDAIPVTTTTTAGKEYSPVLWGVMQNVERDFGQAGQGYRTLAGVDFDATLQDGRYFAPKSVPNDDGVYEEEYRPTIVDRRNSRSSLLTRQVNGQFGLKVDLMDDANNPVQELVSGDAGEDNAKYQNAEMLVFPEDQVQAADNLRLVGNELIKVSLQERDPSKLKEGIMQVGQANYGAAIGSAAANMGPGMKVPISLPGFKGHLVKGKMRPDGTIDGSKNVLQLVQDTPNNPDKAMEMAMDEIAVNYGYEDRNAFIPAIQSGAISLQSGEGGNSTVLDIATYQTQAKQLAFNRYFQSDGTLKPKGGISLPKMDRGGHMYQTSEFHGADDLIEALSMNDHEHLFTDKE